MKADKYLLVIFKFHNVCICRHMSLHLFLGTRCLLDSFRPSVRNATIMSFVSGKDEPTLF